MMRDKVFLDTNILIYLVNEDSPFHDNVSNKFKEIASKGEIWISRQVLREYAVAMTRSGTVEKPLSPENVASDIEKWKNTFHVADETEETTRILVELIKSYKITGKNIHDANIFATMMANSIHALFTLNTDDFQKFKDLTLITI